MASEPNGRDGRTRRECIAASGALVGGTLVAGCTGDGTGPGGAGVPTGTDGHADDTTATGTSTVTEASTETASTDATANAGEPYTVSMSPIGEVSFEEVPEDLFTVFTQYADRAVALGRGADVVNGVL